MFFTPIMFIDIFRINKFLKKTSICFVHKQVIAQNNLLLSLSN